MKKTSKKSASEFFSPISTKATKERLKNVKTEWLIDGLIPKGSITMLYAPAGAGKSHLLQAFILEICKCESIEKIYYLDDDNGEITLQDRGIGEIESSKIDYLYNFKAPDKYFIFDGLLNEVDNLNNTLICIDSIGNFINFDIKDDSLVGLFMDKLIRLRAKKGATIIFLHHQPKQYDGENNRQYKGSTRFLDYSDEGIYVGRATNLGTDKVQNKIIFDLEPQKHRNNTKEVIRAIVNVDNHSLEVSNDVFVGLNEKQTITMEIGLEILKAHSNGLNQSQFGNEIKALARANHYEILGDNAMWSLFRKYRGYKYTITKQPKLKGGFELIYKSIEPNLD